MNDEFGQ